MPLPFLLPSVAKGCTYVQAGAGVGPAEAGFMIKCLCKDAGKHNCTVHGTIQRGPFRVRAMQEFTEGDFSSSFDYTGQREMGPYASLSTQLFGKAKGPFSATVSGELDLAGGDVSMGGKQNFKVSLAGVTLGYSRNIADFTPDTVTRPSRNIADFAPDPERSDPMDFSLEARLRRMTQQGPSASGSRDTEDEHFAHRVLGSSSPAGHRFPQDDVYTSPSPRWRADDLPARQWLSHGFNDDDGHFEHREFYQSDGGGFGISSPASHHFLQENFRTSPSPRWRADDSPARSWGFNGKSLSDDGHFAHREFHQSSPSRCSRASFGSNGHFAHCEFYQSDGGSDSD